MGQSFCEMVLLTQKGRVLFVIPVHFTSAFKESRRVRGEEQRTLNLKITAAFISQGWSKDFTEITPIGSDWIWPSFQSEHRVIEDLRY